jgi:hypothetical protein
LTFGDGGEARMSGQFTPIAVDLDPVRKAVGSKSRSLLPALQKRFRPWFDNVDEQFADAGAGGPSLEQVLKLLIAGKPDVRLAVAEVRSWLVRCDTLGRDLVGFYSG